MVLRFLLDLDHVDSTEEYDVNPVERCLGRPYSAGPVFAEHQMINFSYAILRFPPYF